MSADHPTPWAIRTGWIVVDANNQLVFGDDAVTESVRDEILRAMNAAPAPAKAAPPVPEPAPTPSSAAPRPAPVDPNACAFCPEPLGAQVALVDGRRMHPKCAKVVTKGKTSGPPAVEARPNRGSREATG